MSATPMFVSLDGDSGHDARCRIELSDGSGWNVLLEVDEHVVSVVHCTDWHRVERVCTSIKQYWTRRCAELTSHE